MKFVIILLAISISLTNCETKGDRNQRKNESHFNQLHTLYIVGDVYAFYNICPPVSRVFDPGTYEISLEKGEALYFDISPRLNAQEDYQTYSYYLGVSKDIPSSFVSMNGLDSCTANKRFSEPKPMQIASDSSRAIERTDGDFNYYRYSLAKSYSFNIPITVKAISTAITFKLKIPTSGE